MSDPADRLSATGCQAVTTHARSHISGTMLAAHVYAKQIDI